MKGLGKDQEDKEKLCVLSFDEAAIAKDVEFDKKEERVYVPNNLAQVAIAGGLINSWKQPVFYVYDRAMTKDCIIHIMKSLSA